MSDRMEHRLQEWENSTTFRLHDGLGCQDGLARDDMTRSVKVGSSTTFRLNCQLDGNTRPARDDGDNVMVKQLGN